MIAQSSSGHGKIKDSFTLYVFNVGCVKGSDMVLKSQL